MNYPQCNLKKSVKNDSRYDRNQNYKPHNYPWLYGIILYMIFFCPLVTSANDVPVPFEDRSFCTESGNIIEECSVQGKMVKRHISRVLKSSLGASALSVVEMRSNNDNFLSIQSAGSSLSPTPGTQKWKFEVSGIPQESAVGSDGTVYLAHEDGLYAISSDGTQKWALRFSGNKLGPVIDEESQTIYLYNFNLYAINYDGTIKWVKNLNDFGINSSCYNSASSGLEIGQDGTIYLGVRPVLVALNPSGEKKWVFRQGSESWQYFNHPLVGSDGTIYSGSDDGNFYAIDTDGNEKWHFSTDGKEFFQPAVSSDGQVIYFATGEYLYALQSDGTFKWNTYIGGGSGSPVIGSDGTIYILGSSGLYAFYTNGSEKWHVDNVSGNHFTPFLYDNLIYFAQDNKGLYSFDADGNQKWLYPIDGYTTQLCSVNSSGDVFVADKKNGLLHSVNSFGDEIWSFETKGSPIRQSPTIDHADDIYLTANNGWLYKINKNGGLIWKQYIGDCGFSPTIGADNTVYIGSSSYVVSALNPDGSHKWQYRTTDYYNSSPSIDNAGNLYFTSTNFGFSDRREMTLHAITSNSNELWTANLGEVYDRLSLPAISNDGTIYVVDGKSNISAYYSDGAVKWKCLLGLETTVPANPVIGDFGEIFYSARWSGPFISVNDIGELKWKNEEYSGLFSLDDIIVSSDNILYAGGCNFYAISPSDGTTIWKYDSQRYTTPAIGDDGTVYSGCQDGYVYAFDSSGEIKWRFATGRMILSPPTIGSDGTLYFGDDSGTLYAVNTNSSGLANTSWPMYRNNAQHTGMWTSHNFENPDAYLILKEGDEHLLLTKSTTIVYGTTGIDKITLEEGAAAKLLNFPGKNEITIQSNYASFVASRSGAMVTLKAGNGTILVLPATSWEQTLIFNDRSVRLVIENGIILLDGLEME